MQFAASSLDAFTALILPTCEHGTSFHLLQSSSIFFFSVLMFSM